MDKGSVVVEHSGTAPLSLPTDEYDLLDSYDLDIVDKSARYAQMLQELPVGLTE